ncbi:unnamed protein product [Rangifer tarandus platyrhynchus]|uniref:Basic proline-rich protein-like n=2 Tax=Rangifer tarandus platyrhynchus TaxID=3082113 RepID=A0ABN8YR89_RANTA|nr:unnamed protein product [Rangifer tarandus platyrhynchus]CAI9701905.1 unnamed protein product [Rangifer tarandus platyrhynchus]
MLRVRLPFPSRRRLRGPAEALRPEPPPLVPEAPPQGPPRGSVEAPQSRSASSLLTAEDRRTDSPSPAPRPPSSAPRSCHPAAALPRALGLSPPAPRAARARGEAQTGAPVLTPPQERRCPPQDEWSPGRRRKSRRVGVCGSARTRCPGARRLQPRPSPGPAPALRSAVPAPAARGPRSQPHPPAAASPQPSALRPHPRPHLSCGCSDESGDGGGQTRASPPRSASRPPPSYSHTPPPRGRELPGKGAAREHPRQARAERREAGRPTPAQPTTLREAPGSPSAPWTRTQHALRARAAHTCRPSAGCAGRRGRWRSRASAVREFCSVDAGAGASSRAAWKNPALSPLHLTRPPAKGSRGLDGQDVLKCQILLAHRALTCVSSTPWSASTCLYFSWELAWAVRSLATLVLNAY